MKYDFERIKEIIDNETEVDEVFLGISESWCTTAELIYENGKYVENLEDIQKSLDLINISNGTVALNIVKKDSTSNMTYLM